MTWRKVLIVAAYLVYFVGLLFPALCTVFFFILEAATGCTASIWQFSCARWTEILFLPALAGIFTILPAIVIAVIWVIWKFSQKAKENEC